MTDSKEKDALFAAFLGGALDEAGMRRLLDLLRRDPEAARELAALQDVDLQLSVLARTDEDRAGLADLVMRSIADPARRERVAQAVLRDVKGRPGPFQAKFLGAAAVLLIVLGSAAVTFRLWDAPGTAVAELREGGAGVTVRRGSEAIPGTPGLPLREGDAIEVAERSSAVVAYPDGTRLDLGPETVLRELILAGGKGAFLLRGTVAAAVAPQPADRPMTFGSPHGRARVLGTRLKLVVVPSETGSTRLDVTEGRVRLTDRGERSVEVLSGHYAVAAVGIDLVVRPIAREARHGGGAGKVEDTFVYGWRGNQDSNHGARERLIVGAESLDLVALLRFPELIGSREGQVPVGSTIASARLRVRSLSHGAETDVELRFSRCLKPWGAGRGNDQPALPGEASWNSARHGSIAWQVPGARGPQDRAEGGPVAKARVDRGLFLEFDVTPIVAEWARGAENHGFVIEGTKYVGELGLSSSEAPAPEHRPLLIVTFAR